MKDIEKIQEEFDSCKDSYWYDANKKDLNLLINMAESSLMFAKINKWEESLRWAKRCFDYERKVGFNSAPVWGDFFKIIKKITNEKLSNI